jgi:rSAM/selenodomain-associated transferase 1
MMGQRLAAEVQRELLATTLRRFSNVGDRRTLVAWPADRCADFRATTPSEWKICSQVEGSLGDKLAAFFRQNLVGAAARVVVIGSDAPDLPVQRIHQAFETLNDRPVVLGSADDGGYYLIGMNRFVPMFDRIEWSTVHVFEQTLARLRAVGVDYTTLDPWNDVDDWQGLQQLLSRLAGPDVDQELISLLSKLAELTASAPQ